MSIRPTLKELASMTGMSITTVSRALSDPKKVKYSTRLKIESAMKELQIQSRNEKSGIIGIIVPDIFNQFFPLMLAGIDSFSSNYDSTIMLCNSNGDMKKEEKILKKLIDIKADGIIYITAGETPALLKEIISDSIIPVVFLDRDPGLSDINLITTDNKNGMYQATRYLITLGHKKIIYLGGKKGTSTDNDRLGGFMAALNESGISEYGILHAGFSNTEARRVIREELKGKKPGFTAIAAANDAMALGAISALNETVIKVPEDVSIIGYDDVPSAALADLTTVRQPFIEMGRSAIMRLFASIAEPHTPNKVIVLPSSIVFRNSCSICRSLLLL